MIHRVLTSKTRWTIAVALVSASVLVVVNPASASKKHPSDPATWSVVQGPSVSGIWTLSGVSCPDANDCEAVGGGSDGGLTGTFVEQLRNSVWSITSSPNASIPNFIGDRLNSVSCTDASDCMAVGYVMAGTDTSAADLPLAEWWNGSTWAITSSTSLSAVGGQLNGVSCPSRTYCIAVGQGEDGAFVEGWNGSTWSVKAAPRVDGQLQHVSCATEGQCVAVGFRGNSTSLALRLKDNKWSVTKAPNFGGEDSLEGVSCPHARSCVAAGNFYDPKSGDSSPEALAWNGNAWASTATPANPDGESALNSVGCVTSTDCVAVGQDVFWTGKLLESQPLLEGWNGTSWSQIENTVASPANDPFLNDVSCPSSTFCVAVGTTGDGNAGPEWPLIETGPA
jgi:hypothetical protein